MFLRNKQDRAIWLKSILFFYQDDENEIVERSIQTVYS